MKSRLLILCIVLFGIIGYGQPLIGTTASSGGGFVGNMISNGTFDNSDGWTLDAEWSIAVGVASYDDTDDGRLQQIASSMNAPIETSTDYTLTFDITSSGTARITFYTGLFVVLVPQASYPPDSYELNFTSPSSIGNASFSVYGVSSLQAFAIDNIVLTKD